MLTPEYLAGIATPLQEIYAELQAEIEADIARRLKKASYSKVSDTAAWQIEKLKAMGASQKYIAERIATLGHHTKTTREMEVLFEAAGIKASAPDEATRRAMIDAGRDAPDTPLTMRPAMKQVMRADLERTLGTLQKLTGTMALDASGKLNKYLDHAQLMVQSGAFTVEDAVTRTVEKFAAEGVDVFDYASGVRTSVDAAVRRAVITGVNQATAKVSEANAAALETDLVEVTSHMDARPEHAEWQGKVYSLSGSHPRYRGLAEATGYGTGAGLCGWNCRHSFYAFVEGISEAVKRPEYDKTTYEAEQKQRYNERMIRKWKRRVNTLEAAGVDATKAKARVAHWQAVQRDHVKRFVLARLYSR